VFVNSKLDSQTIHLRTIVKLWDIKCLRHGFCPEIGNSPFCEIDATLSSLLCLVFCKGIHWNIINNLVAFSLLKLTTIKRDTCGNNDVAHDN